MRWHRCFSRYVTSRRGGLAVLVIGGAAAAYPRSLTWRPRETELGRCTAGDKSGGHGENARRVTIVSQNMWNSFYVGGPQRAERMETFKHLLSSSGECMDIVLLQETFALGLGPLCDKSEVELLQRWMKELGFVYQTSPLVTMPCLGQSSGLLICSKQRILSEQHHVFQHRRMVTAKGWLEIEVKFASTNLVIITTHLEHAQSPHWRRVREKQCREIAERIKALTSGENEVLLLGDFNVCGNEFGEALDGAAEYHALLETMASAGLSRLSPPCATLRRQDEVSLRSSPDHIFVSSGLREHGAAVTLWDTKGAGTSSFVSDHLALVATLDAW